MHLVLNLHDGDKLTFEELTDARNLDAIDFDLDKAESLDLYYDKYNSIRLWFDDLSTEDRTETFYKYLYIVCLLYTSDAADDLIGVDLGGRRIIKKRFFSSRRRHTRFLPVSWARRCV